MSNLKIATLTLLVSLFIFSSIKAQTSTSADQQRMQRDQELTRQRIQATTERQFNDLHKLIDDQSIKKYIYARPKLTKEERARNREIVAPNAEDAAKYKDFLKQENTGLFRLFPDFDCEAKNTIRVDGDCANLVPGSWKYSFRKNNYSDKADPDIRLKDGNIISAGFLSQDILTRLGDVSLETVSPTTDGVKFLLDFTPEVESNEVKKQSAKFARGVESGGFRYANKVAVEENTTYAMRIIAYHYWSEGSSARSDKRVDLTVAFRIVRQDDDGSITILWKELNSKKSPTFKFNKNEKPWDFQTEK